MRDLNWLCPQDKLMLADEERPTDWEQIERIMKLWDERESLREQNGKATK